jgi:hypothetical protein
MECWSVGVLECWGVRVLDKIRDFLWKNNGLASQAFSWIFLEQTAFLRIL